MHVEEEEDEEGVDDDIVKKWDDRVCDIKHQSKTNSSI